MTSVSRRARASKRLDRDLRAFKRIERSLVGSTAPATTRETSRRMGGIRQRDTGAELSVRRVARALGIRYTLDNRDLPGSPDLANRSRQFAVFVHGCFWHRHANCSRSTTPKTNTRFWQAKFERNRIRDRDALRRLIRSGYVAVVIWECETNNADLIERRLGDMIAGRTRPH